MEGKCKEIEKTHIAKWLARQANCDEDKENKTQTMIWQGNEKHILENDTAKAPDKRHHVEDKRRDVQADPVQSHSAKTSTKRHHAGDKFKEKQTNPLQNGPMHPAGDTMQETHVK